MRGADPRIVGLAAFAIACATALGMLALGETAHVELVLGFGAGSLVPMGYGRRGAA